jgi:hypothetical protein
MPQAVGVDVGTMFFQTAEGDPQGEMTLKVVRNAFIELQKTDDTNETLRQNKFQYVEDEKNVYVIGEDAVRFARMLPGKVELRRPLQNGVLNADEQMKGLVLNELVRSSIGKAPDRRSIVCTCVSSPPVDGSPTNTFHERRLRGMFENQGWQTIIIPEGEAVIWAENPTTVDKEGEKLLATGIGVSFGAGRANIVLSYKGKTSVGISVGRSGDWIDNEVAAQTNTPVVQVRAIKETKLDYGNIDPESDVEFGIDVYTEEALKYTFGRFADQFQSHKEKDKFDFPLDVVIAGGTSMPKGFVAKAEQVLRGLELPFELREVRHAKDPRNTVVKGLLVRAHLALRELQKKEDNPDNLLK